MRNVGFTLVELAIALLVVGVLLAGALIPLSTQVELRNSADTQRTLDQVKETIIGFAQANGRLPCPADPTIATGTAGAGTERVTCNTGNNMFGVVPWATLGTPETDAWGRRFSYRVAYVFADAITAPTFASTGQPVTCTPPTNPAIPVPTLASFTLCTQGDITVNTKSDSGHTVSALGSNLAAVIISHGKNGNGAYTPGGTKNSASGDVSPLDGVPDTNADEASNVSPISTTFISRTPTPISIGCNDSPGLTPFCEFDDIVAILPSSTLVARMVSAGRLP